MSHDYFSLQESPSWEIARVRDELGVGLERWLAHQSRVLFSLKEGPRFNSQHQNDNSQPPVTRVPGDLVQVHVCR